ncbi:TPA: TIR domain-containing protein [Vibrio parahaemolyticus]|nr:TIR domain-containing protein [Vibrio parahaemolyticus]
MTKKVFISYAHESEELSDSVLQFSNYLRSQGIDSEIDQYEESPPEGWPKWMMRQVQEADYVLVVCSRLFYERANDFSGSNQGSGVKWETNLILQQLYNLNTNNTKFIPIVFERASLDYIPLPLQPYTH